MRRRHSARRSGPGRCVSEAILCSIRSGFAQCSLASFLQVQRAESEAAARRQAERDWTELVAAAAARLAGCEQVFRQLDLELHARKEALLAGPGAEQAGLSYTEIASAQQSFTLRDEDPEFTNLKKQVNLAAMEYEEAHLRHESLLYRKEATVRVPSVAMLPPARLKPGRGADAQPVQGGVTGGNLTLIERLSSGRQSERSERLEEPRVDWVKNGRPPSPMHSHIPYAELRETHRQAPEDDTVVAASPEPQPSAPADGAAAAQRPHIRPLLVISDTIPMPDLARATFVNVASPRSARSSGQPEPFSPQPPGSARQWSTRATAGLRVAVEPPVSLSSGLAHHLDAVIRSRSTRDSWQERPSTVPSGVGRPVIAAEWGFSTGEPTQQSARPRTSEATGPTASPRRKLTGNDAVACHLFGSILTGCLRFQEQDH